MQQIFKGVIQAIGSELRTRYLVYVFLEGFNELILVDSNKLNKKIYCRLYPVRVKIVANNNKGYWEAESIEYMN